MASRTDARLLKSTKFPPEFSKKVDMQKVNLGVMKKWIASRISEILGNEDDVVIEMCFNLIDGPRYPDIKAIQIQLTGFLDKDTAPFCKELWKLFLSAQDSPQGVPKELLEAKKLELIQEKLEQGKAADDARNRRDEPDRRVRNMPPSYDQDRRDRPRDRGDNRQGRWNDRAFDNRGDARPKQRSRSPDARNRMHHNVDEDGIADLRDLHQRHHPEDQAPHHAVALVPLRADEEIH
ncbi:Splicing factor PWI [Beauveria brongniartii RCEF 3172]|uniref:Splicing factor PWI n=1 Tax=Beauveria brongniartii RCEF 3172 TaxID=1081107 RepID=A0A166X241_9HYPO|nr:Splicing factor PWI [Beauveria brongniartii RCEF 3172]